MITSDPMVADFTISVSTTTQDYSRALSSAPLIELVATNGEDRIMFNGLYWDKNPETADLRDAITSTYHPLPDVVVLPSRKHIWVLNKRNGIQPEGFPIEDLIEAIEDKACNTWNSYTMVLDQDRTHNPGWLLVFSHLARSFPDKSFNLVMNGRMLIAEARVTHPKKQWRSTNLLLRDIATIIGEF